MATAITAYVELINEGFQTLREVQVTLLENGLFRLEGPSPEQLKDYEDWSFLPGSTVALEPYELKYWWAVMGDPPRPDKGDIISLVRHPNPDVVRITITTRGKYTDPNLTVNALRLGDNTYEVLSTPQYEPDQLWDFPPGTIVECEKREFHGSHYLQAIKKVG